MSQMKRKRKIDFNNFTNDELEQIVKVKIAKSKDVREANKKIREQFSKNIKDALPSKISTPILRKVKDGIQFDVPVQKNITKAQKIFKKEIKDVVKNMKKPMKRPASISALSIIKRDTNISPVKRKTKGVSDTRKRFNAAFKSARNAGKATFTFDGKKYTTKLKSDKKKTSPSLPKMVTLRSGKKGTIAQRLKEIDRDKGNQKMLSLVRSSMKVKK